MIDNNNKLVILDFFNQLLNVYGLDLFTDINSNGDKVFKLKNSTDNSLGSIEKKEFSTLQDVLENLNTFHNYYVLKPLEQQIDEQKIIKLDDWHLIASWYINSNIINTTLSEFEVSEYEKLVEKKAKFKIKDIQKILKNEEQFYKTICEKYYDTVSNQTLIEKTLGGYNKILHIITDDGYIDIKTVGRITMDNYKKYIDDITIHQYKYYSTLYFSTVQDEIECDLNDLALFDDDGKWVFYLTFEELQKLGYGYIVKDHYPLIEKYGVSDQHLKDFFNHFSIEQLDIFEESLRFYFVEGSIVYQEIEGLTYKPIPHFSSKESYSFNSDILRLACGLISYDDFIEDYTITEPSKEDLIEQTVIKYFYENKMETLKNYGEDKDEGLYHISDLYKDLMKELNIKYENISTEEKEPGEYTTTIEFSNNSISVDTKSHDDIKYLLHNLNFISNEYKKFMQKENEKAINEIDYEIN